MIPPSHILRTLRFCAVPTSLQAFTCLLPGRKRGGTIGTYGTTGGWACAPSLPSYLPNRARGGGTCRSLGLLAASPHAGRTKLASRTEGQCPRLFRPITGHQRAATHATCRRACRSAQGRQLLVGAKRRLVPGEVALCSVASLVRRSSLVVYIPSEQT